MLIPRPERLKTIDDPQRALLLRHFEAQAPRREEYRRRNGYYYRLLVRYLKFIIPAGSRVLEVGCADGHVLQALEPSQGLGIDVSPGMIERARARAAGQEHLQFQVADVEGVEFGQTFDYIVLSDVLGNLVDIQQALENLRSACHPGTRLVIHYHSMFWEPLLRLGERLGLKMPQPPHNWLSPTDIRTFLSLADLELVSFDRRILLPKGVPLLGALCNRLLAVLPVLNHLCLMHLLVARLKPRAKPADRSVTVLIPCRNERGNIRDGVARLPAFGTHQEIIFVDGHSTDGTAEEIEAVIREHPHRDIRLLHQQGRGKGDAVRLGFARAAGDVLMILDADLTVPPEDLPKFYRAIVSGKGEFINGSRLVYPMERQAMRFLNILGNHFFSVTLSWLLAQPLRDTLCGTKVLSREDYRRVVAGRGHFGDFDPFGDFDLIFGAAKLNLKIVEMPVRYRARAYGVTNISRFRHGWLLLRMCAFAFRKLKSI